MAKKDFSAIERMTNPVSKFIPKSSTEDHAQPEPQTEPTESKQGNRYVAAADPFTEPRSRRVQLLMRPSLYSGLKYIATRRKQSINNLVENILAEYVDRARQEHEKGKG